MKNLKRGDIFWVELDLTRGNEMQKTRPGLIISSDLFNEYSNIIMIAPITSQLKKVYDFEVKISLQGQLAKIMLNQMRAIDKKRVLGKKIDSLDLQSLLSVEKAIKLFLALS